MLRKLPSFLFSGILCCMMLAGCERTGGDQPVIGVAFETLQTEYWVESFEGIRAELEKRNIRMLEAIADGDANRQLEQVRNFIARNVDGIIVSPKDAQTVIPIVRSANQAGIPIVSYNRPPAESSARAVTVVADNYTIARETVAWMVEQARKSGGTWKAMIGVGDLSDINAVDRRNGFDDAVKAHGDIIEVVSRVPTEWNSEKALAGFTNALQANPDINFVFLSSDMLLPALVSALKTAGKYKKAGEPGHVLTGGFDGDATAYRMLKEGYLDADGVQDVYFECRASVQAILDALEGKEVPERILDEGFVIHQDNLESTSQRMWGAQVE